MSDLPPLDSTPLATARKRYHVSLGALATVLIALVLASLAVTVVVAVRTQQLVTAQYNAATQRIADIEQGRQEAARLVADLLVKSQAQLDKEFTRSATRQQQLLLAIDDLAAGKTPPSKLTDIPSGAALPVPTQSPSPTASP